MSNVLKLFMQNFTRLVVDDFSVTEYSNSYGVVAAVLVGELRLTHRIPLDAD